MVTKNRVGDSDGRHNHALIRLPMTEFARAGVIFRQVIDVALSDEYTRFNER